jgi:hypothetical protein
MTYNAVAESPYMAFYPSASAIKFATMRSIYGWCRDVLIFEILPSRWLFTTLVNQSAALSNMDPSTAR